MPRDYKAISLVSYHERSFDRYHTENQGSIQTTEAIDMKSKHLVLQLAPLLLIAVFFTGCSSAPRMGKYTYRVVLDEALRDKNSGIMPSIEVDFVGVNESERDRWVSLNIDEYFSPGNVVRTNCNKRTMAFTNENTQPQTLSASDAIWQTWSGSSAEEMFIMAIIPMPGDTSSVDPRRLILPLDQARWTGGVIELQIKPSGVVRLTPMRPLKTK